MFLEDGEGIVFDFFSMFFYTLSSGVVETRFDVSVEFAVVELF